MMASEPTTGSFLSFFLLLPIYLHSVNGLDCSESAIDKCISYIQSSANQPFPTSAESLNQSCNNITTGLHCFEDLTNKCFSNQSVMIFQEIFAQPVKSYVQLCSDETQKQKILKYGPCYRQISLDSGLCGNHFSRIEMLSPETQDLKRTCCFIHLYNMCMETHVKEFCEDKGAVEFLQPYLIMLSGPFKDRYCKGMSKELCTSLDINFSNSFPTTYLSIYVFLLLFVIYDNV